MTTRERAPTVREADLQTMRHAVAGTDLANTHKTGMAAVRRLRAKTHAEFEKDDAS